jgi:hypothetical protein
MSQNQDNIQSASSFGSYKIDKIPQQNYNIGPYLNNIEEENSNEKN